MNIVLIGFMATGKTAVGKILAERLGRGFFDTDDLIEKETGLSISQIFSMKGEGPFRELEARTIQLIALLDNQVIATGGGAPLRGGNMDELKKNGFIVCLTARPETVLERLGGDAGSRPLLAGRDPLLAVEKLLSERKSAYARADASVATDGLSVPQVADEVLRVFPGKR